jgi:FtsP/CotA-like multicopper oxidase with cupredoxin domain
MLNNLAINRAQFLRFGVTVASGMLMPASCVTSSREGIARSAHSLETFIQPPTIEAENGLLEVTLKVSYWNTQLPGADPKRKHPVSLRAYAYDAKGPSYSGPTLVVNGGDQLRIKLVNNLPVNPPFLSFLDPTNYMKPNTTNLHVHGLHVYPGIYADKQNPEYGDYVVDPNSGGVRPGGDSRQYVYNIPKDHPAGPFYYHPQYHGSSAIQAASLMTGAIMVRGPVDELVEMNQAKELIFLFQAPYFSNNTIKDNYGVSNGSLEKFSQIANYPTGHGIDKLKNNTGDAQPVLIDGLRQPTIVLEIGEVQRWRFINTQIFNYLNIILDDHTLHQYTIDGWGTHDYRNYTDKKMENITGIFLAPGNRSSIIIKAGAAGTYFLRSLPVKIAEGKKTVILPGDILAKIVIINSKKIMELPRVPLPVSSFLKPITDREFASSGGKKRNIIFNMVGNDITDSFDSKLSFFDQMKDDSASITLAVKESVNEKITLVNSNLSRLTEKSTRGAQYFRPQILPNYRYQLQQANSIIENVILGSVEEWTIFNFNNFAHAFHIHVNPMYITKVNDYPVSPYWCDTVSLPSGGTQEIPTSITFRMRFINFTGPYILHSQMLKDSDLGMVQRVTVLPV